MASTSDTVLKDLKANKYAPVYFLQGEEPYYIDLISDYIEKNCIPDHEKSFNQTVLYGKETTVNIVLQNAKKFPMMAERQVVIVKEAQELPDLNKEQGEKFLNAYIQNPLPSTILVFCHKYKTLDGRKSLGKNIDKFCVLMNTKKIYDNQLPDWISKFFVEKGVKITPKATQLLAENIGNDLSRQANEIEKLLINLKDKKEVDETLVEKYVGISKDYNVFELQKAFTNRDVVKANRIINYFESNPKSNPIIPSLAVLFGFFNKILLVHGSENKTDAGIAKALGVNPFFAKDYTSAAKTFPVQKTINIIRHLHEADLRSKGIMGNSMEDGQIMKELVFQILH